MMDESVRAKAEVRVKAEALDWLVVEKARGAPGGIATKTIVSAQYGAHEIRVEADDYSKLLYLRFASTTSTAVRTTSTTVRRFRTRAERLAASAED